MFDHISPWPAIILRQISGSVRNRHLMQRDLVTLEVGEGGDLADRRRVWIFDVDALGAQVLDRIVDVVDLEDDAGRASRLAVRPLLRQHAKVASADVCLVIFLNAFLFVRSGKLESERVFVPFSQTGDVLCRISGERNLFNHELLLVRNEGYGCFGKPRSATPGCRGAEPNWQGVRQKLAALPGTAQPKGVCST